MKKVFCTIVLIFLIAGTSYAQATFSMAGNYEAEGKYWFNYNATPRSNTGTDLYKEKSFGFYEQDINLYPKIEMDSTSLNFRIAITDTNWGANASEGSEGITQKDDADFTNDDNMQIERAYLSHSFSNLLTLDVGLMDGTEWATTFSNDKQARWRVKAVSITSFGAFGAILEKDNDRGAFASDDDYPDNFEGEDCDTYGLFWVGKAGNIFIKPLLWYVDMRNIFFEKTADLSAYALAADQDLGLLFGDVDLLLFAPQIGFDGELGPLYFESEFNYFIYDLEAKDLGLDEKWSTFGIYLNFWKNLDSMTPGFIAAYGSYNDTIDDAIAEAMSVGNLPGVLALNAIHSNASFDFKDDFNSTIILGDEIGWGGGGDLLGATLLKFYVNDIATGINPLSLNFYAAYIMSNQENTDYEDATAWEASLGADYNITDNLKYSIYGAYADINYDVTGIDDPDSMYILANAIRFTF